jgi:hypothetical protein
MENITLDSKKFRNEIRYMFYKRIFNYIRDIKDIYINECLNIASNIVTEVINGWKEQQNIYKCILNGTLNLNINFINNLMYSYIYKFSDIINYKLPIQNCDHSNLFKKFKVQSEDELIDNIEVIWYIDRFIANTYVLWVQSNESFIGTINFLFKNSSRFQSKINEIKNKIIQLDDNIQKGVTCSTTIDKTTVIQNPTFGLDKHCCMIVNGYVTTKSQFIK